MQLRLNDRIGNRYSCPSIRETYTYMRRAVLYTMQLRRKICWQNVSVDRQLRAGRRVWCEQLPYVVPFMGLPVSSYCSLLVEETNELAIEKVLQENFIPRKNVKKWN